MSKRNSVAFVKPEEPSFLKKLKREAGFKEGPTVDTKRQHLPGNESESDEGDYAKGEEEPTIVVLNAGDLTAEEVAAEKRKLKKEEENAPADLSKKIVFRSKKTEGLSEEEEDDEVVKKSSGNIGEKISVGNNNNNNKKKDFGEKSSDCKRRRKDSSPVKANVKLLSFHGEDDEEEDE